MLKWIVGSKVDHPLADAKQARTLVSDLPANDTVKALDQITRWLEALAETEGLKPERLFEIVDLLDSAAKNHQRKLLQDYLAMARPQKAQEQGCGRRASNSRKRWVTRINCARAAAKAARTEP